nr:unnamed protein product [Callosobruchus chinensis]
MRRSSQDMPTDLYSQHSMLLQSWIPEEKRCLCTKIAVLKTIHIFIL